MSRESKRSPGVATKVGGIKSGSTEDPLVLTVSISSYTELGIIACVPSQVQPPFLNQSMIRAKLTGCGGEGNVTRCGHTH